jgi:hypothetical protein
MSTITVDAEALKQILLALNGPGYMIRELQVTRGGATAGMSSNNPIDVLERQYIEQDKQPEKENDGRPSNNRCDDRRR